MIGIPYMGSKRKLAPKIVDYIISHNPETKYVYDLFGGGGAVSFEFLKWADSADRLFPLSRIQKVTYNEIDPAICNLLEKIRDDGFTYEFYKWVDRDAFDKHKDGIDWKAGLIKTCWSFGNNGKDYIYGENIECDKKLLHDIVANKDTESLKKFNKKYNIILKIDNNLDIQEHRLYIAAQIRENEIRFDLQHLESLARLQHLEALQNLQNLNITNKSYKNVKIDTPPEETIIYLDPPYEDTGEYQNGINHSELWNWVRNSPHKIYISSYQAPFECVKTFQHLCTLSATNNSKRVEEKLFCNKEEAR